MGLTTPRYVLRYPIAADPDNVPSDMLSLATDLDNKIVGYSQGTLAARPAAGVTGREYRATDTGQLYMDIGTAWVVKQMPRAEIAGGILAYNAAWPSSPFEGQEADRYSDAGSQVIWRFKYRAANPAGYQWVFIGGAAYTSNLPVFTATPTARTTGLSGGLWPNNMGATFTPGVGGIFRIAFVGNELGSGGPVWLALTNTAPAGAGPANSHGLVPGVGTVSAYSMCQLDLTGTAGTARTLWAYSAGSFSLDAGLEITPVKLG